MFNSGYRSSIDSLQEFPQEILELAKESPAIAPQLASSLETSMDNFLYQITVSVAEGWSDSLWALLFVVAEAQFVSLFGLLGRSNKLEQLKAVDWKDCAPVRGGSHLY